MSGKDDEKSVSWQTSRHFALVLKEINCESSKNHHQDFLSKNVTDVRNGKNNFFLPIKMSMDSNCGKL